MEVTLCGFRNLVQLKQANLHVTCTQMIDSTDSVSRPWVWVSGLMKAPTWKTLKLFCAGRSAWRLWLVPCGFRFLQCFSVSSQFILDLYVFMMHWYIRSPPRRSDNVKQGLGSVWLVWLFPIPSGLSLPYPMYNSISVVVYRISVCPWLFVWFVYYIIIS